MWKGLPQRWKPSSTLIYKRLHRYIDKFPPPWLWKLTVEQAYLAINLPVLVVVVLDRRVVLHDERLLNELHSHRRFAHAAVAHDH